MAMEVSEEEGLAGGAPDEISMPGRQPELMGVPHADVGPDACGDRRREIGIGQDIHPRRGRHLAGYESVGCESRPDQMGSEHNRERPGQGSFSIFGGSPGS